MAWPRGFPGQPRVVPPEEGKISSPSKGFQRKSLREVKLSKVKLGYIKLKVKVNVNVTVNSKVKLTGTVKVKTSLS